jgi:DNA-binding CsgD family transcriptional regulator
MAPLRSRIDQLIDEAYSKLGTAPAAAVRIASSALRHANRIRYTTGVARARMRAGQAQVQLGQYNLAMEQFELGLIAARRCRDRATEAMCANGLGISYDRLGQYEPALACFERFIDLSRSRKDLRTFVMATVNIGHVLERTEQVEEAMRRYRLALKAVGDATDVGLSVMWMNVGACLGLLGQYAESALFLERAMAAFASEQRPLDALLCRLNLAETAHHLGDTARVDALLNEARTESVRLGAVHLQWRTLLVDGLLKNKRRHYAAAVELLIQALTFSQRCDEPDLLRMTHQELSEAYEGLDDHASALRHYKVAAELQLRAAKALAHTSAQQALQFTLRDTAALLSGQGSARMRRGRASAMPRRRAPAQHALSAREQDVLERLVQGQSNRVIGEELGISPFTARYHVSSIFNKLGVTTRGEAVTRALGSGLVKLTEST